MRGNGLLNFIKFRILREKGTERPGTGEYDKHYEPGVYQCAGCGTPLYKSATKFKVSRIYVLGLPSSRLFILIQSGCGWPAFFDAIPGAVNRHVDTTLGMKRIEITCAACDGRKCSYLPVL